MAEVAPLTPVPSLRARADCHEPRYPRGAGGRELPGGYLVIDF
jgi:hypothetical protein